MGREVRKVPANWDHPNDETWGDGRLQPMYDRSFADEARDWKEEFAKWEAGWRPDHFTPGEAVEYWEYSGPPPERRYYRPWRDEEATWWQLWETVSEGTPVSPPFATKDELVDYLATKGDFWDQKRGDGPWNRKNAAAFAERGWAPSLIVMQSADGRPADIRSPRDGMPPPTWLKHD